MNLRNITIVSVSISAIHLSVGLAHGQAADGPRTTRLWGNPNNPSGLTTLPIGVGSVASIDFGNEFALALTSDGRVRAWGRNLYGEANVPPGISTVRTISAGVYHAAAATLTGQVVCWGGNFDGQCNVPTGLPAIVNVEAGSDCTMAIDATGVIRYWGTTATGALVPPSGLAPISSISVSKISPVANHALALTTTGSVIAWGANGSGQRNVPTLPPVIAVSAGSAFSVALTSSGQVVCWGSNLSGQCSVPSGLGPVVSVAAGDQHVVGVEADGTVTCWGLGTGTSGNNGQFGQCVVPSGLGFSKIAAAGPYQSAAIFDVAVLNPRTNGYFDRISSAIFDAVHGDLLIVSPNAIDDETVDFAGKGVDLSSATGIMRLSGSSTLFAHGARLSAADEIALNGSASLPTNATVVVSGSSGVEFGGVTLLSAGASLLANSGSAATGVSGTVTLGNSSSLSASGAATLDAGSVLQSNGGTVVADSVDVLSGATLVSVGGMVGADLLQVAGNASLLDSTIVGNVDVSAGGNLSCSGQLVGSATNSGRVVTADDLLVTGSFINESTGVVIAQLGTLYIAGGLVNNGAVYGTVVVPPAFQGGGTGGTQPGDGISIAGSLEIGHDSSFRFAEASWRVAVCGDVSIACPSNGLVLNDATLLMEGCDARAQSFEATSQDLGCSALPFSGEENSVSLIGRFEIASGVSASLVDHYNNAPGKGAEVVYAKRLTVGSGAILFTNGIKVITRGATILGQVDDPSNICVLPDVPNPDINGDGNVNAIDLSFVLTYWGTDSPMADLDWDGIVGASDLSIVLGGWTG